MRVRRFAENTQPSALLGIVTSPGKLRFLWSPGSQQDEENQLQRLPVPTRDHSAGDLALPPVHPELARRRDLLAERGITVSYESIRRWINHFGPMIAADLRRRRPKLHTSWHLDEVYLKIDGRMVYLWRAVDAEGEILEVLVQWKRDKHAAVKLMRKLLKKYGFVPDRLITDDLRSYATAARDLGIEKHHERGRSKNNRVENSHQPTRRRDRKMQGFKSPTISLNPCSRLQHLRRPTSSDISVDTPQLPRRGDGHLARRSLEDLRHAAFLRYSFSNVTKPSQQLICLKKIGAGEGIRTLDPDLGKVVLYP
jgi:transposase-like protein